MNSHNRGDRSITGSERDIFPRPGSVRLFLSVFDVSE